MKKVMKASDVGSALKHLPGHMGRAVFSTLEKGQYAINAKSIVMENARTGETFNVGSCSNVKAKELFASNMELPKRRLESTFAGVVGEFFASRGTWKDKGEWIVKYTEA
jgi:hypothetical protein